MHHDFHEIYWWNVTKRGKAIFDASCSNIQQVKVEHQGSGFINLDIEIPTWMCEYVNMDFVVGSPHSSGQHDSIWLKVDRLT